ncbi:cyclic dehypoxanthinyl futalosine synthase [Frankia sp. CiP3]|uniref:cyclic dehypoxanthinyl futalosine synthase n=1 Tax=Frankia sp. CiP3 TaxID=2880971 RepID=UPI001EF4DEFF|nr:cyclic dehypoxanthinyl futalosine synthase [Frankia sp. CiP3]
MSLADDADSGSPVLSSSALGEEEIASVLAHAAGGGRITPEEALRLYTKAPLHALGQAADAVRRGRFPDGIATYIIDRNINYTNVCVTACRFCAFYRAPGHSEGWVRDVDDIVAKCGEAVELGATQIMLQGGHHPEFGIEWYEGTFAAIRRAYPQLTLHSLGASEVVHIARTSGLSHGDVIARLRDAGLDSFAGAGAEILTERPRRAIAPLKEPGQVWLSVMETAHGLGMESTATFMMGTGETNAERIEHLRMIRDVQDRTGGFRSFIPWTYQPENNHLRGRTQASTIEYLRLVALARLFFDNIAHLQGSWLTTGKEVGQLTLHMGADDLGSVMLEENVVSSAGARHRTNRTELIGLIRAADRIPAQRDTLYRHLVVHRDPTRDPVDDRVASHFSSTALPSPPMLPIVATR